MPAPLPTQVVLDTNVLVAAARSQLGASFRLVELFAQGDARWQPHVSVTLVLEYEAKLKDESHRQGRPTAEVDIFLEDFVDRSERHPIYFRWRPILPDAGDEFILELAVAAQVDVIVTHNRRNFLGAKAFGISIMAPGEFLTWLEEHYESSEH